MTKRGAKIITLVALLASLVGVILWQILLADSVNYYITSVAILLLSMVPFLVSFEAKSITAREVTLVATLIALAVVSRSAFYLIPQVKPIAAVVIVSAICLGAERGYIIGAMSMFVSNFQFGQGYWTPFQMVAMGIVGLLAGLIFKVIKKNRINMALVGFVLVFIFYGLIVDASTVLMTYGENPTLSGVLAIYGYGVPFSATFGATTAVFLFVFGEAFIKKIDRVNTKFGIITT